MIGLADVQAAREVVHSTARHTPMKRSTTLSAMTGGDIHLKLENFQRTGSFKVRGALNKIHHLSDDERKAGVVCASAGNHAQGVAFAATQAGVRADVFMPEDATLSKAMATRAYGAKVHLKGRDYQEAYEHALAFQSAEGRAFVHAYDDEHIMAGQGTLGLELLEDVPKLDTVLVPIGGGGLIAGVATALKGLSTDVRVIGVQAEGASTVAPSLQKGRVVPLDEVNTMADGIACRTLGTRSFEVIQERVDDIVTVSESEISAAVLFLLERAKTTVEGAGAVTLAAALHGKVDLRSKNAALVVSGGNIDMTLLSRIIQRGLMKEGRIAVFDTILNDRPGAIAGVLDLLAAKKANVLDVRHDRNRLDVPLNKVGVEFHVEARGPEHIEVLRAAMQDAGHRIHVRTEIDP